MAKTEIYSWRLTAPLKSRLEEAARRRGGSLSSLLETITDDWLRSQSPEDDEASQAVIRRRAMRFVGSISGSDPGRSRKVSQLVRERLAEHHASQRPH